MSICRVAMLTFAFGDPCAPGELYSPNDLKDVTEFCQAYLNEGMTVEPMDGFSLQGFIDWAAPHLPEQKNLTKEQQ